MENASKALLMAGGILIAMLILAMGVTLFATYSGIIGSYDQTQEANEITKFNSNFIKFVGRKDITAQEIVTLANFVRYYNEQNGTNIKIKADGKELEKKEEDLLQFIKDYSTKDATDVSGKAVVKILEFSCIDQGDTKAIDYNASTGRVNSITFTKNT